MKKRFLPLALSLLMVCVLFAPAFASFDTSTRESVVMVESGLEVDAGTMSFGWGSGFFVGEDGANPTHLITNYHVISDFVDFGAGDLKGYSQDPATGVWYIYDDPNNPRAQYVGRSKIKVYYDSVTYEDAFVVEFDEVRDVALLKLSSGTSRRKPIHLCLPTDEMVGSTVYAIGFPGLSENLFAGATSSWGTSDVTVTRGAISRILTTAGTGQQNIQIDCDIRHGNSGGPLVNEYGAIGINTWSVSNGSGEQANYAVSIREAITLLDRNRVAYKLVDPSAPTLTLPPEPVVSAGLPVDPNPVPTVDVPDDPVDDPSDDPSAEPSEDPDDPDDDDYTMVIIVGVAAAVVIAGIVVAVVLTSRKKKAAAPAVPPAAPPAGPQYPPQSSVPPTAPAQGFQQNQAPPTASLAGDSGLRIQGVTGSFAGRRIAIPRQLRIGRDPQRNDLVYPAGVQGISGVHCVLLVENGMVYVKDLGSTYGTYVGGRRLAANETVPLRVGDRFSLGSDRETFQIAQKGGM